MGGKPTNEAKVFHCIDLSRDPAVTRVTGVFDESYGGASRQLIEQEESREGEKEKLCRDL